jgi:hypothetical protein
MGRTEFLTRWITSEPLIGMAIFIESEMALFSECMQQYTQKLLDTADIVRDAILQKLWLSQAGPSYTEESCAQEALNVRKQAIGRS